MQILVTGGTGVVGASTVSALLERGHHVRLFSRHAERDALAWPNRVTAIDGDVADAASARQFTCQLKQAVPLPYFYGTYLD